MSWLRQRLFATPIDAAITLVCLYVIWRLSVPLVHWLLLDATWNGTSRDDCTGSGACWVFVRMRFGQFMYGQYPVPERWRVDVVVALWILVTAALCWPRPPERGRATLAARRIAARRIIDANPSAQRLLKRSLDELRSAGFTALSSRIVSALAAR